MARITERSRAECWELITDDGSIVGSKKSFGFASEIRTFDSKQIKHYLTHEVTIDGEAQGDFDWN